MASRVSLGKIEILGDKDFTPSEAKLKFLINILFKDLKLQKNTCVATINLT